MNAEYRDLAALSGDELSELARVLLSELEGADAGPSAAPGLAEAVGRLSAAVGRFIGVAAPRKGAAAVSETAEGEKSRPALGALPEAEETAAIAWAGSGAAQGERISFPRFEPAAVAEAPDLERFSELIRRDSRRCDPGFRRY